MKKNPYTMNQFNARINMVRAVQRPWADGAEVLIRGWRDNKRVVAAPLSWVELKPEDEGQVLPPTFNLTQEECQVLMDDLWNCGIRPTEGSGSAGSLAATQRHLEDMRSLVFKTEPKK